MKPDKIYLSLVFLLIMSTVFWISSCTHDADITGLPEVCFQRDVLPIYSNSCANAGCHDGTGEHRALNTYTEIRNTVVPYSPDKSQSYTAIISKWSQNRMPPGQPLSEHNRTLIRVWIEQGANDTKCDTAATAYHSKEVLLNNPR